MNKLFATTLLAAALASAASAQSTTAYVFGAPGGVSGPAKTKATLQLGGGLEVALPKGFGAGVEAGAISPLHSWGDDTLGFFSPNGYYHFKHGKEQRIDPFVTAGYTMFFRDGHINLFNFGGGANLWATRHFGARVEVRDQVDTQYQTVHYWGFRLGLAFR
jgi:hypothetical protein